MSEQGGISAREKHLLWVIEQQDKAISIAGPLLASIGESRSRFADEAWGAFSFCLNASIAAATIDEKAQGTTIQ